MRIALVALSCQNGGMLHYATQLANALTGRCNLTWFTPPKSELLDYLAPGVKVVPILPLSFPGHPVRSAWTQANPLRVGTIALQIRLARPDVVHMVTDHPSNPLLLAFLGSVPGLFTHHDPSGHPGEGASWRSWLTHRTARRCDRVVVHGEALAAELATQGVDRGRIAVVPHGTYAFLRRHAAGRPEEPMILCLGRLIRYKGLDVLCRAERLLAEWLRDYRLVIAGEGDASWFKPEIGPSGRVQVIDRYLSDAEVAALVEAARVVVLPYTQASQSGVLAIAQAFGKATVVTDVGGLPEGVGFGAAGVVVPAGDPAVLAEAIAGLWHDAPQRARLGAAGRAIAETATSLDHIATAHLDIYRQTVEATA